jgi:hypothetical protein
MRERDVSATAEIVCTGERHPKWERETDIQSLRSATCRCDFRRLFHSEVIAPAFERR